MTAMVLIALGSNQRHGQYGDPRGVLRATVRQLDLDIIVCSRLYWTPPMGPKQPQFANAALIARTTLAPEALLARLKALERSFGRKPGRRWGPRVLDLDLIAYEALTLNSRKLTLPHPGLATRPFVLWPTQEVWPGWRHPRLHLSLRQLAVRRQGKNSLRPAGFL
jgi:2-amino-4-hydroxy-6-hydroxymethyldihydropteridine diphosphokinase